jgi:lauroyl/myristoyl acyltransferase
MKRHILNRAFIYKISLSIARIVPLCILRCLAKNIAVISYFGCKNARLSIESNLSNVLKDHAMVRRSTWEVFRNYCIYLADWAKFSTMETSKVHSMFTEIQGGDIVKKALSKEKGVILLTAHLGNWELGSIFFHNYKIPINIVTGLDDVQSVADIREKARFFHNVNTITLGKDPFSSVDIVRALNRNELVAMLIDRYRKEDGILIDFFGKAAYFPSGPILLARITGAAVIPAFTVMTKDGTYKAVADSIIEMEFSNDKEKDIQVNLKKIVRIFEKYIQEYVTQWYNFSPIWGDN